MIKGNSVYLRLMMKEDISRLCDLCNDESVNKYNNMLPDKKYLRKNFNILKKMDNKILTIINEKDVIVGFMDYRKRDLSSAIYTIGITIGQKFWGRGYGKESIKILCDYLFEDLGAEKIVIEVIDKNVRAIKCYESCGFIVDKKSEHEGTSLITMVLEKSE
ncbi:Protein N-acetyltransferase, RimJ/RimL family [Clostridium sp. DSM 8431]|uniref:GNAT family N-acetyltransferase n=1 Tax=Clostridium sp. DSM 8431 TaxID=1761781 RepID=UPI0008E9FDE7|nr:GNAT family N-acetyltransferase [Clostridium sp. DSM 8431]SFU38959.1 Protein N-acetyltransferase, RimJ/RimL family [Clostridium sp. DSM 8431]